METVNGFFYEGKCEMESAGWVQKVADEIDWISPQAHPPALLYVLRRTI